ncbi:MAG: cbb3-type cytochrome c oxidase subunit 3 [Oligoflexia bacterium]|nr:cbb3-type cytochrome c oxidase subunit 3 [Oligoflexia bacterium]
MIREVLSRYPYGAWSGVAMLLFLAVFLGAVSWVCRRRGRAFYAALAQLPFSEPEPVRKGARHESEA